MFARECNQQCEIWLAYLYFSARKCCSHKCCNTQQSPIYLYLKNPFAFLFFPTNQYLMLLAYTKVVSPNAMINSHLHQCQQLLYYRLLIIKKKSERDKIGEKGNICACSVSHYRSAANNAALLPWPSLVARYLQQHCGECATCLLLVLLFFNVVLPTKTTNVCCTRILLAIFVSLPIELSVMLGVRRCCYCCSLYMLKVCELQLLLLVACCRLCILLKWLLSLFTKVI